MDLTRFSSTFNNLLNNKQQGQAFEQYLQSFAGTNTCTIDFSSRILPDSTRRWVKTTRPWEEPQTGPAFKWWGPCNYSGMN